MVKNTSVIVGLKISALLLSVSYTAQAEDKYLPYNKSEQLQSQYKLTVLEDRGGELIDRYIPKNKNPKERMLKSFAKNHKVSILDSHYPVVTEGMTVGRLTDEEVSQIRYKMLTRSVFVVGYDPVSMKWMEDNSEFLSNKRAIGLVVNVESKQQLQEMQALVGDKVVLQPTPGETLVEHVKITHYPFYVDYNGVIR